MYFIKSQSFNSGKNLFVLLIITLLSSCATSKKDTYYYLTAAQEQFINTANTGDTVVWESSSGDRDTAIIQPVIHQTFLINSQHDGDTYGSKAYYSYNFIGTKKTNIGYGIIVENQNDQIFFLGTRYALESNMSSIYPLGMFNRKKIGSVEYYNVYWSKGMLNVADTIFWNANGCLGTTFNSETVYKIR